MPSDLNNKKFIIAGFTAGFSLLVLYFIVLSLVNSFSHALEQFSQLWYWILVLVAGFGQGSHHLAGILIFPKLGNQVKLIKLIIKDIPPRTFEWNLE